MACRRIDRVVASKAEGLLRLPPIIGHEDLDHYPRIAYFPWEDIIRALRHQEGVVGSLVKYATHLKRKTPRVVVRRAERSVQVKRL